MRKKKNKFKVMLRNIYDIIGVILFFIVLIPFILFFIIIILFCKIFIPKAGILNDDFEDWRTHG
ncbi:MAG TPA: hypothetical protein VI911_09715 [Patescibacteria group bacterium]|nr:hypothetical protein [Patescibacteria group bacterium]